MFHSNANSSFCFINRCNAPQIEDLQNEHEPTSALLDYCKRKVRKQYQYSPNNGNIELFHESNNDNGAKNN